MTDWREHTLGAVATFTNGGAWHQDEYSDAGVPVVRVTNIADGHIDLRDCKFLSESSLEKYKKHMLQAGDVLIATVGSHPTQPGSVVGRSVVAAKQVEGCLLNQNAVAIRPSSGDLFPAYLGYLARSSAFRHYIVSHARGSANQVRASIGALKAMPLMLPPLRVQRRIATILSGYDDLHENNARRIAVLRDMVRSLYREWFLDFRFPGYAAREFIESEVGQIPREWHVERLDAAMRFVGGKTINKQNRSTGSVPVYGANGIIGHTDEPTSRQACIILGKIGACGSLHRALEPCWVTNNAFCVLPGDISSSELGWQLLNDIDFRPFIGGSANPYMPLPNFGHKPTLVPEEEIQQEFEVRAAPVAALQDVLRRKNEALRSTRDLLLPRLISGELDVSDLDIDTVELSA